MGFITDSVRYGFISELSKLSEAIQSYKCSNCGYVATGSEDEQSGVCPECGETMADGPGYDTRVNS